MKNCIWAAACAVATGLFCLVTTTVVAQQVVEFTQENPAGYVIAGEVHMPEARTGHVPVVILISGSGPQDRDAALFDDAYSAHRHWRAAFNDIGFAVISFDETGMGESGGTWGEMGLEEHKTNVATLLDLVAADTRLDAERVYLLGHSEGGLIATMLASEREDIAGLILAASPGAPLVDILEYQMRTEAEGVSADPAEQEAAYQEQRAELLPFMESTASLRDGLAIDPLDFARQVNAPAIIVQGENDWQVRPDQADLLGAAITEAGQLAEVHRVPDVNHLLVYSDQPGLSYDELDSFDIDPRLSSAVTDWLQRQ